MQHNPDPVQEIDVSLPADDGTMFAGTLAVPSEGASPPYPAAVMLWPGKFDRAGNMRNVPLELGRPLAAELARRGVASYRFDRRGVGATPGDWLVMQQAIQALPDAPFALVQGSRGEVFPLLAGPALSLPSMIVIHTILGPARTAAYVGLVVVAATLTGWTYGTLMT